MNFPARLSISEALAILKISEDTFHRRVAEGKLAVSKDGRRTFVSGAELERYLASCEQPREPAKPQRSGFFVGSLVGDTI